MTVYNALGIMTGTSLDGIDLAVVRTDGLTQSEVCETAQFSFSSEVKGLLRSAVDRALAHGGPVRGDSVINRAADVLTRLCIEKSEILLGKLPFSVDMVGFHGQTVLHAPQRGITWQIGNPTLLANGLGLPVIADFRQADVAAGGQGAPLVPLYHGALVANADVPGPVLIINLGGVANITWIFGNQIYAFDTGPGNGLIDSWVQGQAGIPFDENGALAAMGTIDIDAFTQIINHPFFAKSAPKSMDRYEIGLEGMENLMLADGASTLTAVTAWSIRHSMAYVPTLPRTIFVAGGGAQNQTLMQMLQESFPEATFKSVSLLGSNPHTLEAEAFAYLAVRSYKGLPLSLPTTTGVPSPQTGGVLVTPQRHVAEV